MLTNERLTEIEANPAVEHVSELAAEVRRLRFAEIKCEDGVARVGDTVWFIGDEWIDQGRLEAILSNGSVIVVFPEKDGCISPSLLFTQQGNAQQRLIGILEMQIADIRRFFPSR